MSDDTHVTDVGGLVHKGPDLVCIVLASIKQERYAFRIRRVRTDGEVTGIGEKSR